MLTTEDITERKNAEQQLQTSRELLKSILDGTPVGIEVMQSIRNENGEVIDFEFVWV